MRFDVGAKFVAAKKRVTAEERVTFTFEIIIFGEPGDLIAAFFHPTGEVRSFARPLFVSKITWDKSLADSEPGIGGEKHVRQFRLRREENEFSNRVLLTGGGNPPLFLGGGGRRAPGAAPPRD